MATFTIWISINGKRVWVVRYKGNPIWVYEDCRCTTTARRNPTRVLASSECHWRAWGSLVKWIGSWRILPWARLSFRGALLTSLFPSPISLSHHVGIKTLVCKQHQCQILTSMLNLCRWTEFAQRIHTSQYWVQGSGRLWMERLFIQHNELLITQNQSQSWHPVDIKRIFWYQIHSYFIISRLFLLNSLRKGIFKLYALFWMT